ncbi:MAG: tetratricopeptide repeat protein [Bacillota bacterium]|nr:tetratricopeptide repeat protein [Bacillota bacterium]
MNIIEKFLIQYTKEFDFYHELSRNCAQICETQMEQMGIRAIVTSRAKKIERLRDKLEKRSIKNPYKSFEDIYDDIVDLSGVRIALYFPGDLNKVQQFIESNFEVVDCKSFPEVSKNNVLLQTEYQKRFSGYWATHYRIHLKSKDLPNQSKKYVHALIEIQIASALMHAWAEVEHDMIYKPFSGDLSYEEYQILDELNGLVIAGEIALERLQKAVKNRVSQVGKEFNNHYELAMFLYNKLGSSANELESEIIMGRVDLLFNCLKSSKFNKPEYMKEFLVNIDPEAKDMPIVDQIMENIRELNPMLYESYLNVKQNEELKYQIETLQMNRENGNRQGEANTLANIGFIYSSKGNQDEAIKYFSEAVQINNEIGGRQGEANQLLNLGATYRLKGELDKALLFSNKALEIHTQIDYKQGQANALGMIGKIFCDKNNYAEALNYYNQSIKKYKETNYKRGEADQLNNIGLMYKSKDDITKSLEYYNKAMEICNEIDYIQGKVDTLYNIGTLYREKKETKNALKYYNKALEFQECTGNQKSRAIILISIGYSYAVLGNEIEALKNYKEALQICNSIEFKSGEELAIENIKKLKSLCKQK